MEYLIILVVLGLLLLTCLVWLCLETEQTKKTAVNNVRLLDHQVNLMKAKLEQLIRNERDVRPEEIAKLKEQIAKLETKMTRLDISMNRFAPPLDENTNYKTISISGIIK